MILTRQMYDKYVKPLYDKLYQIKLSFEEELLVGEFVKKLCDAEFELNKLQEVLSEKTVLQTEFLEKNCKEELERLEEFLNAEKDVK